MKRIICLIAAAAFVLTACSAQGSENSNASSEAASRVQSSAESSIESSEEISDSSALPMGVNPYRRNTLRYTSPKATISVSFPDVFCVEDKDYSPADGIYLTTREGRQSLQIEAVTSENADIDSLKEYLKKTYPDAEISVNDDGIITCKMDAKDKAGNNVRAYLKAKITGYGYNEAVLYFLEEDKTVCEPMFNKITLQ